jgi:hypothetical protein
MLESARSTRPPQEFFGKAGCNWNALFAGSASDILQIRLALLGFLALRLADDESTAADILCLIKFFVCQLLLLRSRELK